MGHALPGGALFCFLPFSCKDCQAYRVQYGLLFVLKDISVMNIVILAAGMGKRMRSRLPKVLQPLADKPMLEHVIEKARL